MGEYIRKKDVLDLLNDWCRTTVYVSHEPVVVKEIKALPSVIPTRKKGKWIGCGVSARCNDCGCKDHEYSKHRYCPYCGREMEMEV